MECYSCHKTLDLSADKPISRSETCDFCYTDLRCCKMCEFYDANAYNECREPSAERVVEKTKGNFCDYFKLADKKNSDSQSPDPFAAANALFKN